MTRILRHIFLFGASVIALAACSGKARIIPEKQLEAIYEEMFITDQWITDHSEFRLQADTTLVFDPVFARYGYDFEDYDATVRYYAAHPEQFWDLVTRVSDNIAAKADAYTELANDIALAERTNIQNRIRYSPSEFNPEALPMDLSVFCDSLYRLDSALWVKLPSHFAADTVAALDRTPTKAELLREGLEEKKEMRTLGIVDTSLKVLPMKPLNTPIQ